jgi:hypothetical protein
MNGRFNIEDIKDALKPQCTRPRDRTLNLDFSGYKYP